MLDTFKISHNPSVKKDSTPSKNLHDPSVKKDSTPSVKIYTDNTNISKDIYMNTNITYSNRKKNNNYTYSFDDYWELVPNRKNKGQARNTFNKLMKSDTLPIKLEILSKALIYERIKTLFKYKYQQNPSTWLNSENWHQEYTVDSLYEEISSMYSDFEVKMQIREKIESIFVEYKL